MRQTFITIQLKLINSVLCRALSTILCFAISHNGYAMVIDFKAETTVNFRHSENIFIATNFPPDRGYSTADKGNHLEVSNIALFWNINFNNPWSIHTKVDAIDLYEKNPSSSDLDISLDKFIIRYGKKSLFPRDQGHISGYIQAGKFGKFERQEDRRLESYGVVSTAFNRVEDSGLELGLNWSSNWYSLLSFTTGNPVFFRDPNALAGDNGVRDNTYESGILVLYDAEIERLNLERSPETGIASGYRWISEDGNQRLNVMLFGYQRQLQASQKLHGTLYGGDRDLFEFSELYTPGPVDPSNDQSSVPLSNNKKWEGGMNVWWYGAKTRIFFQAVNQHIGGLKRFGAEVELSYAIKRFDAYQWLARLTPVIRYSTLHNRFNTPANNPSPSIGWDWQKVDIGFKATFSATSSLVIEYAHNRIATDQGSRSQGEFLATYTWVYP